MTPMTLLSLRDVRELLPDWTVTESGRAIHRDLLFTDFGEAFAFMTQVAVRAEKLDHHPEWTNAYHRVSITLTTHDASGLTIQDIRLAQYVDHLLTRRYSFAVTPMATS